MNNSWGGGAVERPVVHQMRRRLAGRGNLPDVRQRQHRARPAAAAESPGRLAERYSTGAYGQRQRHRRLLRPRRVPAGQRDQAEHLRARRGHPVQPAGQPVRSVQRHLHGRATRRGRRRADVVGRPEPAWDVDGHPSAVGPAPPPTRTTPPAVVRRTTTTSTARAGWTRTRAVEAAPRGPTGTGHRHGHQRRRRVTDRPAPRSAPKGVASYHRCRRQVPRWRCRPATATVTVSAYGYGTRTATVTVADGRRGNHDFALAALPMVTSAASVTDGSGHGWPLYAKIDVSGGPAARTSPTRSTAGTRSPCRRTPRTRSVPRSGIRATGP